MKKSVLILSLLLVSHLAKSQTLPAPVRLRCDLLLPANRVSQHGIPVKTPLETAVLQKAVYQFPEIISTHPAFNWEADSAIKKVTAWQIMVASSADLLEKNKADFWNSGKTAAATGRVNYAGKPLPAGKVYFWKVALWNERNQPTAFSKPASFYIGTGDSTASFSHHPLAAEWEQAAAIVKKENGQWFLDFAKDGFGQLQLHLTSAKDDSVWIEAAEALSGRHEVDKRGGSIRYIRKGLLVKKGTHDYTIQWPVNEKRNKRNPVLMPDYIGEVFPFRYVTIENLDGELNKGDIRRKTISYPFDDNASAFESSDSVLNKVWDLCRYSIKATSFSGYYVDGDRERLPYEADALINQLSHYAVDAEFSMARRSMAFLLYHPTWPTEWSLQNIMLAWNDYLYTGDDAFLRKYYGELQKKILMPLARPDGLISTKKDKQSDAFLASIHMMKDFDGKHGLKDNVDWPQKGAFIGTEKEYGGETDGFVYCNYNSVINAWYYQSLILMQKIAATIGQPADAAFYDSSAKKVYQSFRQTFASSPGGLISDGDTTSHSSLHANMFALAFGLVPAENQDAVTRFIKSRKMACSVYGAQFLLEALYNSNQDDYALELLTATTQRSWYNMIRTGSTITMEAWDQLYKPNLDLNHAWGSAPANIIVRKLMGIEPLTPGGGILRIKPRLGTLGYAKLKTTTLRGTVTVNYQKTAKKDTIEITIPGAVSANIILPFNAAKPGIWMDGKKITLTPQNGEISFTNVAAGRHVWMMQ